MNIQEFRALELKIRDAKCVEDVFGETEPDAITLGEIKGELLIFRDEIKGNEELLNRANFLIEHPFSFFWKWAFRQKNLKKYGNRDEFPIAVHLEVVPKEGEPMFLIKGRKSIAYLSEIHAASFNGYWHRDKVIVRKDEKLLFEGRVTNQGTHAAQEYFHGVTVDDDRICRLEATMYEPGITIEIQTWAFFNLRDLLLKEFQ